MKAVNNTVDFLIQGTNDTFGMPKQAVSGAINAVNRVASGAVNTTASAMTAVNKGMWDDISNTADAVGKVTVSGNKSSYDFGGKGESIDYERNPPKYSDVPERDYLAGRPNNKEVVEMNCERCISKRSFEFESGKDGNESKYSGTENGITEIYERTDNENYDMKMGNLDYGRKYKDEYEPQTERPKSSFRYSDRRRDDYEVEVPIKKRENNNRNAQGLDSEKLNQLIELINQMPSRRNKNRLDEVQIQMDQNRDRSRRYEFCMENKRGGDREDEQNIRDRYQEDNVQMKDSKSRFRGGIFASRRDSSKKGLNASSSSSSTPDSQFRFGFHLGSRMNDRERKKFKWSKFTKQKNENIECQEFASKKVCSAELDMVPCMVPRLKCTADPGCSCCGLRNCCPSSANIDPCFSRPSKPSSFAEEECCLKRVSKKKCFVPKCVMVPCGEVKCCSGGYHAQLDENCDYGGRFNRSFNAEFDGDVRDRLNSNFNEGMNDGFKGEYGHSCRCNRYYNRGVNIEQDINTGGCCFCYKPRRRRFSGSSDGRFNDCFNRSMSGGFDGGVNIGINDGFYNGTSGNFNGGFINRMTEEGFNTGMSNGMKSGVGGNITNPMNGNMLGMNSFASTNGLSNSLNALNEALSGIVSKLPHLNAGMRMNLAGGMKPTNLINVGLGGRSIGGTMVSQRSLGGGQNPSIGANFGGMSFGMQGNSGATDGYDDKFGEYGGSLEEIRNIQGAEVRYLSQPSSPSGINRASSLPPGGFHRSVGSNTNATGLDDDKDYVIKYIEPDMEEYNRKVREAEKRAEQKRQDLIRQRDAEVARKRAEMEKQIEEEYKRRKAEAERQREAEIKARISKAQGDIRKKEQYIVQTFTEKLKAIRDAETEKRIRYERALAEANQKSQPLKQQFAMAQRQLQELEACKAQLQQQEAERRYVVDMLIRQIQTTSHVPAYKSDTSIEKELLADFCQKMSVIKCQEKKVLEEVANIPLPNIERPEMPEIPIPEIPEVVPEHVPMPQRLEIRIPKRRPSTNISPPFRVPSSPSMDFCPPSCVEFLLSRGQQQLSPVPQPCQPQLQCPQRQPQNFSLPAFPMISMTPVPICMPSGCCSSSCMPGGGCGSGCCNASGRCCGPKAWCKPSACCSDLGECTHSKYCKPDDECTPSKCCKSGDMSECCLKPISSCCDTSGNCKPFKFCKPGGSCEPSNCCKPKGCCLSVTCNSACCAKDNCSNDKGYDDTPNCESEKKDEKENKCEEKRNCEKKKCEEKREKRPQSAASRLFSRSCMKKSEEKGELKVSAEGTDEGKIEY